MNYIIFGESHGPAIGVTLTGVPAGLELDWAAIEKDMARRAPGKSPLATARKEADQVQVLSGVFEGKTTGSPLCAMIANTDTRSADYSKTRDLARPGHADYPAHVRYQGFNDYRGGGHFSGRLTAPLVFAGAIAKQILAQRGITVGAHISSIYGVNDEALEDWDTLKGVADKDFPVLNDEKGQEMQEAIAAQKAAEEAAKQQALQQQQQQGGGTVSDGGNVSYPTTGGGVEGFDPIWPLPGVTYISAGYNGYPGHKGLDIAGPYGTPVVAAEDGQVIVANNYDSWGDSWGYYVLIYHNGTYTTRYAHLSSVAVSQGQYVTAGTVVGYEGATGNVTGPHLHFEVYQNGTRVDPMQFL